MDHKIYKYIQKQFSQRPKSIDSLIVSAFLKKNKLQVKNNIFIKEYIIDESNPKAKKNLESFIALLDKHYSSLSIETIIKLFEFVISPSDRIVTGAIYTPEFVRKYIISQILDNAPINDGNWKAADVACGCGGFLYTLAKHLNQKTGRTYKDIFRNNVYGLDIKEYSTTRTKILLSLLAISSGEDEKRFDFNLFTGDALNFNWNNYLNRFTGFNCIIGNPPYVCSRKIEKSTKVFLSNYEVCSTGHPDLYIPFFEIALKLLKKEGILGFITMNSFFKSLNGRALRHFFEEKKYNFTIYDFGTLQVFNKRSTYTCICIIQNIKADSICYTRLQNVDSLFNINHTFTKIPYLNLKATSGWNLLNSDFIQKIESKGTPFSKKFTTRTGIATLKNDVYIFDPVSEDKNYYYLLNGSLHPIEKAICKEIINSNKLATEVSLNSVTEKVIFPYHFVNGKAVIMDEKELRSDFPCAYKYLKSQKKLLGSRDKGEGKYMEWFAYGRTQCLEQLKYKLFFPHITSRTPHFIINTDENLFFYNGLAVIGKNEHELKFLEKLMSSKIFWFYLQNTSKPYASGYISMSKNYIKDFGVYDFTEHEIDYIINESSRSTLDAFFQSKYEVDLDVIN